MTHRAYRAAAASIAALGLATPALAAPASLARTAPLVATGGAEAGSVTATEAPGGVILRVEARGMTPGWHAIHIHAVGDCGDGAKKAGGHVHAGAAGVPGVHGLLNPRANDKGDLPNIHVAADGTAAAELFTPLVSLGRASGRMGLLDADGSAVVIHANADDHLSQPIGGAGDRVACAVLK